MANGWIAEFQRWTRAGRAGVRVYVARDRSWLALAVAWAFLIAAAILGLLVLAALTLIAIPVFVVAVLVGTMRRWITQARGPNGVLDGRRNVRVIVRDPSA